MFYFRIKTNSSEGTLLVIPVEVEVSSKPGIFCPIDVLDFGVMRSQDDPKTLKILLYNSGQKPVVIQVSW